MSNAPKFDSDFSAADKRATPLVITRERASRLSAARVAAKIVFVMWLER